MRLKETIYLSLAAVAMVIGIHRTMLEGSLKEGILFNYWIFMGGLIFLMLYRNEVQKKKEPSQEKPQPTVDKKKKRPQRR